MNTPRTEEDYPIKIFNSNVPVKEIFKRQFKKDQEC